MRINSMKLAMIMILDVMVSGVIAGLFILPIPSGNMDVLYMMAGVLLGIMSTVTILMFKKEL